MHSYQLVRRDKTLKTSHRLLGIDIGKGGFVVAFPPEDPRTHPENWRSTVEITYDNPDWWRFFLDMIDEVAVIAAEPTGTHLLAPLAALIHEYRPNALLYRIDHRTTKAYRELHVSRAKNDRLDAITLCLIAAECVSAHRPPNGAQLYDYLAHERLIALRLLVNEHQTLTKETTRARNRLHVLAHHVFPPFAGSETYLRLVDAGMVSIDQVREAVETFKFGKGAGRSAARKMTADSPTLDPHPVIAEQLRRQVAYLRHFEAALEVVDPEITRLIELPDLITATHRWRSMWSMSDILIAALHVATAGQILTMSKDDFRAAIGVNPIIARSGNADETKLSKRGYRPARAMLHIMGQRYLTKDCPDQRVREAFDRAKRRGGKGIGAAKNKLARILWGVARDEALDGWRPPERKTRRRAEKP